MLSSCYTFTHLFNCLARLVHIPIPFGLVLVRHLRLAGMWDTTVKRSPHVDDGVASVQAFAVQRSAGAPVTVAGPFWQVDVALSGLNSQFCCIFASKRVTGKSIAVEPFTGMLANTIRCLHFSDNPMVEVKVMAETPKCSPISPDFSPLGCRACWRLQPQPDWPWLGSILPGVLSSA